MSLQLPAHPSLEWLRKSAKQLLAELRERAPQTKLAEAQLALARRYGFASWRKLVAFVDAVDASGDELRAAVRANDVAKVAAILDDDPELVNTAEDLHERERPSDEPQMSLLHLAVAEGHLAMAELLVDRLCAPFGSAAPAGEAGARDRGARLDARNRSGRTALHDCFELGRDDIARMLIARGATLDVCLAAAYGNRDRLEAILRADPAQANDRSTGLSPLGWATYGAELESIEILLAHGATLDAEAWDPACHVAQVATIRAFLAHGADPNLADARGRTPLHRIFESRLVRDPTEAVRVLLAAGADPYRTDHAGRSPLDEALAQVGRDAETYFPRQSLGEKQLDRAIALMRARGT